jgi:hypothetical protein
MIEQEIRKVQKPRGTSKEGSVQLPIELGFEVGASVRFEKIDEKNIKIIKVT